MLNFKWIFNFGSYKCEEISNSGMNCCAIGLVYMLVWQDL